MSATASRTQSQAADDPQLCQRDTGMVILQPFEHVPDGANYVGIDPSAKAKTGHSPVLWGRLPCRTDATIASVVPGEDITIDTVSHEGLMPDQGSAPVAYFASHGVPRSHVLDDAVAIVNGLASRTGSDGPHVVTGPIRVSGAHPGDLLAVTIRHLEPRVPYGVISTRHGRGVLADSEDLDGNYGQFCRVEDGHVVIDLERADAVRTDVGSTQTGLTATGAPIPRITFPIRPFLGITGIVPDTDERPNSIPPGDYGGNIDLNELTEGATLFLPVQVQGAGLYVGDPHFAQGNGEVALTALEASLRATLHVEVIGACERRRWFGDLATPFALAHGNLIAMGMHEDLDEALRRCVRNAVGLIASVFGVPERQAYLLLSAAVDCDVTQAVDLVKGAHALIPVSLFSGVPSFEQARAFFARFGFRDSPETLNLGECSGGSPASRAKPAMDTRIWRVAGNPLVAAAPELMDANERPLEGVGVAVKDLFAVRGFAIGVGNPEFLREASPEPKHAFAVQRLLDAGAHITGIAQTDEFAYSLAGVNMHYGTPPNVNAPGRISGGSTSGPTSAVSSGQVELGLGTDTAGSIRIPAAYQGLWGIRTTHGSVSREGVYPLSDSFDTVGWVARDVETFQRAGQVLLPLGDSPSKTASSGTAPLDDRTILVSQLLLGMVEPDVSSALAGFLKTFDTQVSATALSLTRTQLERWVSVFQKVRGYEAWQVDGPWVSRHWDSLDPQIAARFRHDSQITLAEYREGVQQLANERLWLREAFGRHVLLLPTASSVAPKLTQDMSKGDEIERARASTLLLTSVAGVGGLPAVTIPLRTAQGLPCGVCLVGPAGTDRELIALAGRLGQ